MVRLFDFTALLVVTFFYPLSRAFVGGFKVIETRNSHLKFRKTDRMLNVLLIQKKDEIDKDSERKIVKYDNVGDPVFEDELKSRGGVNILGLSIDFDPITMSLVAFGLIAFNFFVLANL